MTLEMGTVPQILFTVRQMVHDNFLDDKETATVVIRHMQGVTTEGEMVEMLQELIDIATIKKLCS